MVRGRVTTVAADRPHRIVAWRLYPRSRSITSRHCSGLPPARSIPPSAAIDVAAWSPGSCLLCLSSHAIAFARHVIRRRSRRRGRQANQVGVRELPSPGDEQEIGAHPTIGRPGHRGHPGIGDKCITASDLSALGDTSARKASPIVPRPQVCRRWATPPPGKCRLSS